MSPKMNDKPGNNPSNNDAVDDGIVRVCLHCQRINTGVGIWRHQDDYAIPKGVRISHGLCLTCCEKLYGPYCFGSGLFHRDRPTD